MMKAETRKKVLIVGPSLEGLGGVANYYRTIYPMLEEGNFSTSYLPIGRAQAAFGKFSPVMDQFRLASKLVSEKPDLVHINPSLNIKSFIRDMFFILLAKLSGAKCIVFFRGWEHSLAAKIERRFLWLFKSTYGKADAFIVLATEFREKLTDWTISTPIHIETTTVPDTVTQSFNLESKLARLRGSARLTVVYMGRLEREKGILETLAAIELLGTQGLVVDLLVAGSGDIEGEVLELIENSPTLRSQVDFVGYVREDAKISVMERGDVFCFPTSYGEGMPNALLEAMAFGMALITCPVAGIKDIVVDGENGFFVDQENIVEIAEKIEKLCSDRALLCTIAKRNEQEASERFMASKVSRRLLDIYASVLGV